MTDVVDELRKQAWRRAWAAERRGEPAAGGAKAVKGSRYALLKNPERPHRGPGRVAREGGQGRTSPVQGLPARARLRDVFKAGSGAEARLRLESWLASACRTRIDEVRSSKKVRRHKDAIVRPWSSAFQRQGRGHQQQDQAHGEDGLRLQNFDNLVALVMLRCSNLPIALPGR